MSGYNVCLSVTPECPVEASIYGYYPSLGANAFFVAFYVLFFLFNLGLGVYYKTWTFAVLMCIACLIESVGYGGRIMLHANPYDNNGFIMQICCLIMGPAWNSGALYLTLKYITLTFGSEWSRIKPWLYTWVFITGDFIALLLQAVGGAMASTADGDMKQLKNGDNIAMAGITWQVFTLLVFAITTIDYIVRRMRSSTPLSAAATSILNQTKFRVFAAGLVIAWLTIFTRCVFRIAEFAKGWGNPIMTNQTLFIVLEGVMVAIATFCQSVPHPGFCFPALSSRKNVSNTIETGEPKVLDTSDNSDREVVVDRK